MPVKAEKGTLPAVVVYHPYGVRSASIPARYAERAIAFDVNANGLENGREASFYRNLANGKLKNYFFFGNTDRETIYFKDMYLRALRALEFMKSRPEWNKKDLVAFLAHLERKGLAVVAVLCAFHAIFVVVDLGKCISRVEDSEKKLVAFLTVFSKKSAEVLHRRSLYRSVSVCLEYRTDGVEYVVSACHLCRSEVSCSLWN